MKKPTPKKKQCKSSSRSRHHTFQAKTRVKLMGKVNLMKKLNKLGKFTMVPKSKSSKITTVKA